MEKIKVTIWNEARHEQKDRKVRKVYPKGIHGALADGLGAEPDLVCRTATLDERDHGLTEAVLDATDVLIWWGHIAHDEVEDRIVERVRRSVEGGMGLIVLHSGHFAKIFRALLGTPCTLRWREAGERERIWTVEPDHPIAVGIGDFIELPQTEMYGERFDIPAPDQVVFISWFEGGEVFRSGCCWERGLGRLFYFRPGHETYPIYRNREILQVIANAVRWAKRRDPQVPSRDP